MVYSASILLVDDDEAFLRLMGELLVLEGYCCDCASNAAEAIEKLKGKWYDLLIADIRMPGNSRLEFIQEARHLTPGTPVILVTGYPSLDSAVSSVQLSVDAYLTKPFRFDELRAHVEVLTERSQGYRTIAEVREHLQKCVRNLEDAQCGDPSTKDAPHGVAFAISPLTIRSLASCLSELLRVRAGFAPGKKPPDLCQLLDCPQRPVHRDAVRETIEVLKKTKGTFKSKELAELRAKLERLLEDSE